MNKNSFAAFALLALATALGCSSEKAAPKSAKETPPPASKAIEETAPVERTDLIGRGGKPLTLIGTQPAVGDNAPDFVLKGKGLADVPMASLAGKVIILSVVPSIDTRVCETQTHKISELELKLLDGVEVLTISRDLPFAQTRFVEEAKISTTLASDYRTGDFGRDWGLEVKETGLLARSVWVIDAGGTIVHRELVSDQSSEPDYDAILASVREHLVLGNRF